MFSIESEIGLNGWIIAKEFNILNSKKYTENYNEFKKRIEVTGEELDIYVNGKIYDFSIAGNIPSLISYNDNPYTINSNSSLLVNINFEIINDMSSNIFDDKKTLKKEVCNMKRNGVTEQNGGLFCLSNRKEYTPAFYVVSVFLAA